MDDQVKLEDCQLKQDHFFDRESNINPIEVHQMDLRWMYSDNNNFIDFLPRLDRKLPNHIYESRFMDRLLAMHWNRI